MVKDEIFCAILGKKQLIVEFSKCGIRNRYQGVGVESSKMEKREVWRLGGGGVEVRTSTKLRIVLRR